MSAPETAAALTHALSHRDRGWRPFPLDHPELPRCIGLHGPKNPCPTPQPGGAKRGKHPHVKYGTACASEAPDKLVDFWFGGDPRNIGIACGPSGLVVFDEDELNALPKLALDLGQDLPVTYRVRTSRGWHWYFEAPDDIVIGNRSGRLENWHIDVRGGKGKGGFVVAAGSMHVSGHRYTAEDPHVIPAPMPRWLIPEVQNTAAGDERDTSARTAWDDEPRYGTRDQLMHQYRRHVGDIRSRGGEFRHELFVAARDGWRLVHLDVIDVAQMSRDLRPAVRAVWGADPDERDVLIVNEQAREAAERSPWILLDPPPAAVDTTATETAAPMSPSEAAEIEAAAIAAEDAARLQSDINYRLRQLEVSAEAQRLYNLKHRPKADIPDAMLLPDLLARPVEQVRYRIDGLLGVGGRVLLAAAHKAGKTTLMGNLIRCLVDGGDFLGRYPVEPIQGRVILLDTELPERLLQEWLARQCIQHPEKVAVISLRDRVSSFDLTSPEALARWTEKLGALEPGFVILDCLRPVLDAAGLDEKSEAGRFLVAFGELLGRLGVEEAALVQHMGHTGERARGDSVLLGWPDVNWKILRKEAEDDRSDRYFSAFGRDVDVPEQELGFNSMTGELLVAGGSRRNSAALAALVDIVSAVTAEPGLSGRLIEAALAESDHARKDIRAALKLPEARRKLATRPGLHGATLYYPHGVFSAPE